VQVYISWGAVVVSVLLSESFRRGSVGSCKRFGLLLLKPHTSIAVVVVCEFMPNARPSPAGCAGDRYDRTSCK
jgi:hypothetical protein